MTNEDLALRLDEDMNSLKDVMRSLNAFMTDQIMTGNIDNGGQRIFYLIGRARKHVKEARELLLTAIEDELGGDQK